MFLLTEYKQRCKDISGKHTAWEVIPGPFLMLVECVTFADASQRFAKHGGEAEAEAVVTREHGLLGGHLGAAVKGDGAQRRFLGAKFAFLADAIAAVGDGHDDALVVAGQIAEHFHSTVVHALGRGAHASVYLERISVCLNRFGIPVRHDL